MVFQNMKQQVQWEIRELQSEQLLLGLVPI